MNMGRWTFSAVRKGSAIFPSTERAEKIIRSMPFNKDVLLEARTARNAKHHDLFFVVLDRIVEATGRFPDSDALNRALKFELGIVSEWIDLNGEVHIEPGSIAWSAMPQDQFSEYFEKSQKLIVEHFFGELDKAQQDEINTMWAGELGRRADRGGRGDPDQ